MYTDYLVFGIVTYLNRKINKATYSEYDLKEQAELKTDVLFSSYFKLSAHKARCCFAYLKVGPVKRRCLFA